MDENINLGDKVFLKSGSPELTVVGKQEEIVVEWRGNKGVQKAQFPVACLTKVKVTGS